MTIERGNAWFVQTRIETRDGPAKSLCWRDPYRARFAIAGKEGIDVIAIDVAALARV